ncbi:MAG: hypothetical protein SW833_24435 [Cyanobacteriota bacterium]|nr:hypothetical protein [Cyanobacteriota bacterium]
MMNKDKKVSEIAEKILKDPISMQKLCDRVYRLMLEDLRNQRDRAGNSRR